MTKVTFINASGERETVVAPNGFSLMEAAIHNDIEGIAGECGGACSCGTCHIYIEEAWIDRVPPPADIETDLLEAVERRRPNSRLACQIKISPELDTLVVTVAS